MLHKLAVSKLNKVEVSEEMVDKLGKFSDNDDRFLKEYFSKQEKIQDGVIKKLENSYVFKDKIRI